MADNVYKAIEVIGTSAESLEKAAATAVERASKTLRDLRVAEAAKLAEAKRARHRVRTHHASVPIGLRSLASHA